MATKAELVEQLKAMGIDPPEKAVKAQLDLMLSKAKRKALGGELKSPGGNAGARI